MVFVGPILFLGWKVLKRTHFIAPEEADLVWEKPAIDAYEDAFEEVPLGFWQEIVHIFWPRKKVQSDSSS